MKIFKSNDDIISLENVRRVEKQVMTTTHTSYGQKYTVDHCAINIIYTDGQAENINCGEGRTKMDETFEKIFKILSEG